MQGAMLLKSTLSFMDNRARKEFRGEDCSYCEQPSCSPMGGPLNDYKARASVRMTAVVAPKRALSTPGSASARMCTRNAI